MPDGNYPNPENCSLFITCNVGFLYLRHCPYGLHYSNEADACVFQEESNCFTCPKKNHKNNPNGLYANPEDCCSFIQCAHGHPYVMACPDGLQWSTKKLRCEWPKNSDCGVDNDGKL
ncbi:4262_t:CDS:2, partial [Scutellospora calospora]